MFQTGQREGHTYLGVDVRSFLWLILGSFLLAFTGWRWNASFAVWLAPVFLMRFVRTQERWRATMWAVPLMTLALFANITGSWDFSLAAEIGIGLIRAAPFLLALALDRALARKLPPGLGTLVYPATYVAADYLLGLSPRWAHPSRRP